MTGPPAAHDHVLVPNRWTERFAEYESFRDRRRAVVTCATTAEAAARAPGSAAGFAVVRAPDNLDQVVAAVAGLIAAHGPLTGLLGLQERGLLVAAPQLGLEAAPPELPMGLPWTGRLLVPTSVPRPRIITRAVSLLGEADTLYAKSGPGVGHVVPAVGTHCEQVAGRFRVSGVNTVEVEKDIRAAGERSEIAGQPV
ncbi:MULTISPECIES: hypothetical protein [unclassified Streptomyces]|uniref:hypothetical protein n=1 Tax=unclassified Streptomyces TaxID=2593676 RepID=UPI0022B60235|nr:MULTISPECIES: hypothetical protein [unclassified Streptomyces]MCZ7416241.1 hypothetical protein [Streptomyces sp. WMMC897]MCZ7433949.1 hypothetical protein [Streptomyces sp. WMMC1477]